jgi:hypothetical protein
MSAARAAGAAARSKAAASTLDSNGPLLRLTLKLLLLTKVGIEVEP